MQNQQRKRGPSPLGPIKDDCKFSVGSIGNSVMAWDASNPGGAPTLSGEYLLATVTFTGLPDHNSDFGKKVATISFRGEEFCRNDYEVFFPKTGKNHPACSTCPECSNWFYYWREGDVCSIPKDAIWAIAEGDNEGCLGWHSNGTIYLTDLAAEESDVPKELTAHFSNPTCEFRIEMKPDEHIDVSDKSAGEKGIAYFVTNIVSESNPELHTVAGIGGDGKGIGRAAQTAVHELEHKAYWLARHEAQKEYGALDASIDTSADEFGWNSIEHAIAVLKVEAWEWLSGDTDQIRGDGVMDSEERSGGKTGILSDMEDCDTYDYAQFFFGNSRYDKYGDEEIRARAKESTAVYHVDLDWSNPGCQYSKRPYGPKMEASDDGH